MAGGAGVGGGGYLGGGWGVPKGASFGGGPPQTAAPKSIIGQKMAVLEAGFADGRRVLEESPFGYSKKAFTGFLGTSQTNFTRWAYEETLLES